MKNTRKKMLLSSIAMLLVALIALGSATFAWYITNSEVTASTSQFSAASADGLVIKYPDSTVAAEKDWTNTITHLRTASNLSPAALNYGRLGDSTLWGGTGQGTAFNDGTLSGGITAAAVTNGTTFLVDSFYVASSSDSAQTCTFKIHSGTVEKTYMNLAVYVGSELMGVYTSDPTVGTTTTNKLGGSASAPESTDNTQALTKLGADVTVTTNFSAATKASGGTKVTIIGYADGYNPLCKNSTADTSPVSATYSFKINSGS